MCLCVSVCHSMMAGTVNTHRQLDTSSLWRQRRARKKKREENNQDGQTRREGRRREGGGMGNKERMTKIEGGVVMMEIGGGKAETGGKEIIGGTEN